MIKVAITGADSPDAGELIRLLAMHPDVEIVAAQATGLEGKPLTGTHHGLIGETTLCFTGSIDASRLDVLFICHDTMSVAEFAQLRMRRPDLKVIMLDHIAALDPERHGIVYGLPEINRKLLVRGATSAVVPESFASMALVALYPFALNLLLAGDIRISVAAPQAIIEVTDLQAVAAEIEEHLREVQMSFSGKVTIEAHQAASRRSALMDIDFGCPLSLQQMLDLYEIYDDHRFSFVTTAPVGVSEVAGTNKCVITVAKGELGRASLGVAADCRLRGAAGEALHIMNLMCGLHERTGLALKAIDYTRVGED